MITAEISVARVWWRDSIAIVGGVGAVAVAVWLAQASVHIVGWTSDGPARVGLFASRDLLLWLSIAAIVCAAAILVWARQNPTRLARAASILGPMSLLWLWAVPYLPWLADRFPLFLVLAGPIRWVIAAVAVAGATRIPFRFARFVSDAPRLPGRRLVFAVSLAAYLAFGLQSARVIGPGGDEPHYLIITQSLLADGDLQIENNHERRDYRAFFGGNLRPDYMRRGQNGQIYSIHAPGLPVLLLPAFALGGYTGSLIMMCLIAALTALAVFDLAEAVAGRGTALFTWIAVCLTVPFLPNAWLIYPEMPGALIVAWAALWTWKPAQQRTSVWFLRGVALALLPWLHTKFIVLLVIFFGALAFRLRRDVRALVALVAPIALSIAAWLVSFYLIYGVFNPEAPYGDYTRMYVLAKNIPRGLLGLFFDQKFGLFFYSPIYLTAIWGCWMMLRRPDLRYLGVVLLAVTVAFVGSTTRLYMWWGGSSAPARFLVPLLPCVAPMLAIGVREVRSVWARALVGVWFAISAAVALLSVVFPERLLLFSDPHGRARLLEMLQGGAPLAGAIPTFTSENWRSPLVALIPWLAAAATAIVCLTVASRVAKRRSPFWLGTFVSVVFLVIAGVAAARPDMELREETARRGALDLIWRWDPHALRAFEYGRYAKIDETRLRELSVVTWRGTPAGPVTLPAGAYEARVWFTGAGAREGEVVVASQQKAAFGRYTGAIQNPTSVPFSLPVTVNRVSVSVNDAALASRVLSTDIVPRAVVPVDGRDNRPVRAIESIENWPGGYVVFVDTATFPEGGVFWTRGTEKATVLVAPAGASRLIFTLHLGPVSGNVRISVAGKDSSVPVPANDTVQFETHVPPGIRLVPIAIQSPTQFRPAEVDSASDDQRRLGCQVRIHLQ